MYFFFFFNDTATTEIYTLSLHDALPISHVLCERPLALTIAGVERVLQASEKYGRRVMVGMNHRFRSDVQAVRGFLAGGGIRGLQAIRCGRGNLPPRPQPGARGAAPPGGRRRPLPGPRLPAAPH